MPSGSASETLYLVDAHSLIFQVFYAIRGMTSPTGMPTNALFGFIRDMLYLRSLDPTYLVCAFDREEPTFRSDLYVEYKAHRDPMPDDLSLQIPLIHQALQALGIPTLSVERFEADDILATLGRAGHERGMSVYLCTADKDCRQLITDRVRIFNLRKQAEYGKAELLADWGVTPEQVVDLQALVGDSVDNVPGVPGIGIKTGAKLLQEFGTLDNLLDNLDKVPGKKQESLRASKDLVQLSRKLVRLEDQIPLAQTWENWKLRPIDREKMLACCREWGFQSLASQIRSITTAEPRAKQADLFAEGEELFPFGANTSPEIQEPQSSSTPVDSVVQSPVKETWNSNYRLIDTVEDFETLFEDLSRQSRFAIDLETTSLSPHDAKIVGIALCWKAEDACYLALRGPVGALVLDSGKTLARLKPLLEDPARGKINQNIKYDLLVLRANGVELRGIAGDSMVADYLLHAGQRSHNLEELSRRYLDHQVVVITELIGKKTRKQQQLRMDEVPTDKVADYAAEDADVAWRLVERLHGELAKFPDIERLYQELELPLIEVLAELEFNGIRLDSSLLNRLSVEMGQQLEGIEKEIHEIAGHPFNIGSLPQLRKVLFEELKLPVQNRTGVTNEPSTDQETLEKLASLEHPGARLPRKILEHRQISKLKGTYVDALPEMVNARTGRIHASFNQTVAATGRISGSDPNLQNIPVRREMGQQIRQAFLPEAGWSLLTADYSQIELRLLAQFCQDEELCRAFAEDRDVHATVASQIFHVNLDKVTDDQRRMAKTVNFGVIYGISPGGLGQRLGISRDEATSFIAAYFKRYPRVEEYQARLLEHCRSNGFVATILGRRRYFDPTAIRPNSSFRNRNQAEREAINTEVQGSAADLIKLAMLNVFRKLKSDRYRARLLLQIHDELVLESPSEELLRVSQMVHHEMTRPVEKRLDLRVPLKVDQFAGPNWLDLDPLPQGSRA